MMSEKGDASTPKETILFIAGTVFIVSSIIMIFLVMYFITFFVVVGTFPCLMVGKTWRAAWSLEAFGYGILEAFVITVSEILMIIVIIVLGLIFSLILIGTPILYISSVLFFIAYGGFLVFKHIRIQIK